MRKLILGIFIFTFIIAQQNEFNSPYLTNEMRGSIKQLLNYSNVSSNIDDQTDLIQFYQSVSQELSKSLLALDKKYENIISKYNDQISDYHQQLKITETSVDFLDRPIFSYSYKPIPISKKSIANTLHKKQAKILKKQYVKLYLYYNQLSTNYLEYIDSLELQIAQNIDNKDSINQSFATLDFLEVNEEKHVITLRYSSNVPIYGFQFSTNGAIISNPQNDIFSVTVGSSGKVIGFSMTGKYLPISDKGKLVEFSYNSDIDTDFCISNVILSTSTAESLPTSFIDCIPIKSTLMPKIEKLVIDTTNPLIFKDAFRTAKDSGLTTFVYNGNAYSTLTKADFRVAFRKSRRLGNKYFYFNGKRYSTQLK
jgi:hypothetical protein